MGSSQNQGPFSGSLRGSIEASIGFLQGYGKGSMMFYVGSSLN